MTRPPAPPAGVPFHVRTQDVPEERPGARTVFFEDPEGTIIELFQPRSGR